jgi:hypothetical protein
MRRTTLVPAALALVLASSSTAMGAATPEKLIGGKLDQVSAFSNGTHIVWASTTKTPPTHDWDEFAGWYANTFARGLDESTAEQLNKEGTWAVPGGFDPGTNSVIFQQVGRTSNLFFYDLETDTRSRVPGVNDRSWEWTPRISASYILFHRSIRIEGARYHAIVLYDRAAQERTTIATVPWGRTPWPTSVGETYAAWAVCRDRDCSAFVYDIASGTAERVPTRHDRSQFAPVLDEGNGRVYFVRSGNRCGVNVDILRVPIDDLAATPTTVVEFDADIDMVMSLAPNATDTGLDLLFEGLDCDTRHDDIYVARDVTAIPET